jgi:succinate dehydrogenase / fumarate reductase, cytochrome b subunit
LLRLWPCTAAKNDKSPVVIKNGRPDDRESKFEIQAMGGDQATSLTPAPIHKAKPSNCVAQAHKLRQKELARLHLSFWRPLEKQLLIMLQSGKTQVRTRSETRKMADGKAATNRPLSPHLQIYRPLINMVMSILHRITGAALYLGTLLLAWWLTAAAMGQHYYDFVNRLFAHPVGRLVLFGYTWALMHHMLGGIRHLIWDTGRGLDLVSVDRLAWATIIGSVILTLAIWALVIAT